MLLTRFKIADHRSRSLSQGGVGPPIAPTRGRRTLNSERNWGIDSAYSEGVRIGPTSSNFSAGHCQGARRGAALSSGRRSFVILIPRLLAVGGPPERTFRKEHGNPLGGVAWRVVCNIEPAPDLVGDRSRINAVLVL